RNAPHKYTRGKCLYTLSASQPLRPPLYSLESRDHLTGNIVFPKSTTGHRPDSHDTNRIAWLQHKGYLVHWPKNQYSLHSGPSCPIPYGYLVEQAETRHDGCSPKGVSLLLHNPSRVQPVCPAPT